MRKRSLRSTRAPPPSSISGQIGVLIQRACLPKSERSLECTMGPLDERRRLPIARRQDVRDLMGGVPGFMDTSKAPGRESACFPRRDVTVPQLRCFEPWPDHVGRGTRYVGCWAGQQGPSCVSRSLGAGRGRNGGEGAVSWVPGVDGCADVGAQTVAGGLGARCLLRVNRLDQAPGLPQRAVRPARPGAHVRDCRPSRRSPPLTLRCPE
ncbi:hypothetical protein C2E23DRAFT_21512 [Lenzites betulinus]|nr:hypothetical protein C2E23DRAFT_21512 [Lenzites betulinus]